MNKAIRAQGRSAFLKLGDMLIEDYLAFISTHIKRCFFQDLPFLWEKNKHHGIFQHHSASGIQPLHGEGKISKGHVAKLGPCCICI